MVRRPFRLAMYQKWEIFDVAARPCPKGNDELSQMPTLKGGGWGVQRFSTWFLVSGFMYHSEERIPMDPHRFGP